MPPKKRTRASAAAAAVRFDPLEDELTVPEMRYQSTIEVLERLGVGHANSANPSTPASYDKFLPYVFQTAIPGLSGVRQAQLNVFKAAVSNAHTDQQVDQAWNSWLKYLSSIEEPEYLALLSATATRHPGSGSDGSREAD